MGCGYAYDSVSVHAWAPMASLQEKCTVLQHNRPCRDCKGCSLLIINMVYCLHKEWLSGSRRRLYMRENAYKHSRTMDDPIGNHPITVIIMVQDNHLVPGSCPRCRRVGYVLTNP
jgi:hypothetical protein